MPRFSFYFDVPALRPGTCGAYTFAFLCAAIATALRIAIDPYVTGALLVTFLPAAVMTALISGLGAGIFCVFLTALGADFFVLHPRWSFGIESLGEAVDLVALTLVGILIVGVVAAMRIAVERYRESQERLNVLVGELQHRTRNLISVVGAMADATLRTSETLDDFKTRFRERLGVLGRAQSLLSCATGSSRVGFDELLSTELAAHSVRVEENKAVTLFGPKGIRLRSSSVQPLAMALHELLTNAVKYGALQQPNAHLGICWQEISGPGGEPWIHIDWKEAGVEMPPSGSPCKGTGQGRDLIERALPYQFDAKTMFAIETDGVHCTISLPTSMADRNR
jgi:two-component sensor histidine kinase